MYPEYATNGVFKKWYATGSRVIVDPPPVGRDEDWVVLVSDIGEAMNELMRHGFGPDAQNALNYNLEFVSMRKGELNLILTELEWLFDRYILATVVAKQLNLKTRPDRVRLFKTIREVGRPDMLPLAQDRENEHA